jgi:hypothetical protein
MPPETSGACRLGRVPADQHLESANSIQILLGYCDAACEGHAADGLPARRFANCHGNLAGALTGKVWRARENSAMSDTESEGRPRGGYFEVIVIGVAAIIVGMLVAHWLGFY